MKEQFTPGEWEIDCDTTYTDITVEGFGEVTCVPVSFESKEQDIANAHLIAAAPKMYRELQLLKMFVHSLAESIPDDGLGLAQAASSIERLLAEARGENNA